MVDHHEAQLALRATLLTLEVATTGSVSIAATSTGYTRSTGSFITDGFRVGMEVSSSDFGIAANNAAKTITALAALTMTCSGCTAESAGSRTLSVALPAGRLWENEQYDPDAGSPWIEEQYTPGPMRRETLGAYADLEVLPLYSPRVYVPSKTGMAAARKYADALLTLFAPNTSWVLSSGTLRVRGDVAPYAGQLLQSSPGFAVVPVNVPLRLRTINSI